MLRDNKYEIKADIYYLISVNHEKKHDAIRKTVQHVQRTVTVATEMAKIAQKVRFCISNVSRKVRQSSFVLEVIRSLKRILQ